jgi:hypothetical protein
MAAGIHPMISSNNRLPMKKWSISGNREKRLHPGMPMIVADAVEAVFFRKRDLTLAPMFSLQNPSS